MNYTTFEQGKRLVELGLKQETADMAYIETPKGSFRVVAYSFNETVVLRDQRGSNAIVYPCWSLDRLLRLIPHDGEDGVILNSFNTGNHPWTATLYLGKETTPMVFGDSPLEVVYEIVIWLLENKKSWTTV